ncbi:hypothetical protein ElyMa_002992400 [Elysia marginata]|uniref:ISXO2-like transposase domain-containing protein n=1 Tax=Elysia marginata TaxID=1093978 RepID=A0AAV4IG87_9GAST|nr:hypothetical protein ElyMa_002992400 [Elysia marginata]
MSAAKKAKYSQEQLKEAFEKVKNGTMSMNRASQIYGIPRTTLGDKLRAMFSSNCPVTGRGRKGHHMAQGDLSDWVWPHERAASAPHPNDFESRTPHPIQGQKAGGLLLLFVPQMLSLKYERGNIRPAHWVLGAIERDSGNCFMVEVPTRNRATLEPIIRQFILPGTHIISDGWAAYANIPNIGGGIYTHEVIIHEDHFVDPDDDSVHTHNIEMHGVVLKGN